MSRQTAQLLEAFEALPLQKLAAQRDAAGPGVSGLNTDAAASCAADEGKRVFTAELLRRAAPFDSGPLDDDETAAAADDLLIRLDGKENDTGSR